MNIKIENNKSSAYRIIKISLLIQFILFFFKFIYGMATAIYVIIPDQNPIAIAFETSGIDLLIHVIFGFLSLGCAIVLFIYSVKIHQRILWILNLISGGLIGLAIHFGAEFYLEGQEAIFSMEMAVCFIVVFVLYTIEVYLIGKQKLDN